jgi:hypothetical protein
MTELRWCIINIDGTISVHSEPTAIDAIDYANKKLASKDEFVHCKEDYRVDKMKNVNKLLKAN